MNVWRLLPSYIFALLLGSAICGILNWMLPFSSMHENDEGFIIAFIVVGVIISFLSSLLILVAVMIVAGIAIKRGNSKKDLLRKVIITHFIGTGSVIALIILFNAQSYKDIFTTIFGIGVYYTINLLLWIRVINKKYLAQPKKNTNLDLLDS